MHSLDELHWVEWKLIYSWFINSDFSGTSLLDRMKTSEEDQEPSRSCILWLNYIGYTVINVALWIFQPGIFIESTFWIFHDIFLLFFNWEILYRWNWSVNLFQVIFGESARCIISQFWCIQTHLWSFLVTMHLLFIKIFTYFPHLRAGFKVSEKEERGWIIAASAGPGIVCVCGKILTNLLQCWPNTVGVTHS